MKLVADPGTEPWKPSLQDRAKLEREFPGDGFIVHLHRRDSPAAKSLRKLRPMYSFRAVTKNDLGVSHVLVDNTETPRSIAWLIAHELSHQEINRQPNLASWFHSLRPSGDHVSDDFHTTDPEELHCDEVATKIFGERLDRAWWRARLPSQHR